ncbi:MAG: FixH family protein [Ktedonobacteraceae bacterium]
MPAQQQLKNAQAWSIPFYGGWMWFVLLFFLFTSCSTPFTSAAPAAPTNTLPTVAVAQPLHQVVKTLDGAFTVTLNITPNRSGPNVFTVNVLDNHTTQPAKGVNVTLYTTMLDMAMGTDSIILHATANGQFSTTSNNLNMGGHWAIAIAIQTPDQTIHKAGIRLVTSL